MTDCIIKIERAKNGFEVEMTDPAIVKANMKPSKGGIGPWKDPKVSYVFKTMDEMLSFIKANAEKALPMDEYESSFNDAAAKEGDD